MATIESVLGRPVWRSQVEEGLKSEDSWHFSLADQAARELGIDTWEIHFKRTEAAPLSNEWYDLMKETDDRRIDSVLELALRTLPLNKIATGPAKELGLGPGWEPHGAIQWVLQDLARFPGKGWPIIAEGLCSPTIPNRNGAINALKVWPREWWPEDAEGLVHRAAEVEPEENVRIRLERLGAGLSPDD